MNAYRIFESLAILALLLYSLRQLLPLFPGLASSLRRGTKKLGLPADLFVPPPPQKTGGCKSCDACTGCGPAPEGARVITLHRKKQAFSTRP